MSKSQWYIDIYVKFFENLPQIYCIMIPKNLVFSTSLYQITLVHRLIFYNFLKSTSNLRNNRYQRVICLSGTSGTRHDTQTRGRVWEGGHLILYLVEIWEILKVLKNFGKYMYIAKSMRFESLMFELLPIHSIQQNVPFYLQLWPIKKLTSWEAS